MEGRAGGFCGTGRSLRSEKRTNAECGAGMWNAERAAPCVVSRAPALAALRFDAECRRDSTPSVAGIRRRVSPGFDAECRRDSTPSVAGIRRRLYGPGSRLRVRSLARRSTVAAKGQSATDAGRLRVGATQRRGSGTRDSNPRHPAWEAGTLPTELVPRGRDRATPVRSSSRRRVGQKKTALGDVRHPGPRTPRESSREAFAVEAFPSATGKLR